MSNLKNVDISKLIHLYETHPAMWDPRHVDYNNKYKKATDLCIIAKELNINEIDVAKKWKNLRTYYNKLRDISKKHQPSVSEDKDISWAYFSDMTFLDNVLKRRSTISSDELSFSIIDAKQEEFDDISIKIEEDESNLDDIHIANESLTFHHDLASSKLPRESNISATLSPVQGSEYSNKYSPRNIRSRSIHSSRKRPRKTNEIQMSDIHAAIVHMSSHMSKYSHLENWALGIAGMIRLACKDDSSILRMKLKVNKFIDDLITQEE